MKASTIVIGLVSAVVILPGVVAHPGGFWSRLRRAIGKDGVVAEGPNYELFGGPAPEEKAYSYPPYGYPPPPPKSSSQKTSSSSTTKGYGPQTTSSSALTTQQQQQQQHEWISRPITVVVPGEFIHIQSILRSHELGDNQLDPYYPNFGAVQCTKFSNSYRRSVFRINNQQSINYIAIAIVITITIVIVTIIVKYIFTSKLFNDAISFIDLFKLRDCRPWVIRSVSNIVQCHNAQCHDAIQYSLWRTVIKSLRHSQCTTRNSYVSATFSKLGDCCPWIICSIFNIVQCHHTCNARDTYVSVILSKLRDCCHWVICSISNIIQYHDTVHYPLWRAVFNFLRDYKRAARDTYVPATLSELRDRGSWVIRSISNISQQHGATHYPLWCTIIEPHRFADKPYSEDIGHEFRRSAQRQQYLLRPSQHNDTLWAVFSHVPAIWPEHVKRLPITNNLDPIYDKSELANKPNSEGIGYEFRRSHQWQQYLFRPSQYNDAAGVIFSPLPTNQRLGDCWRPYRNWQPYRFWQYAAGFLRSCFITNLTVRAIISRLLPSH
ncbi:hypothetical protein B0T19DRAFT_396536 [Cercophora scortea]|uniref:Uncharacterized protein n=1 Tax=Cercophora scortea TaxID=314031 RepID=A0AAE0J4K4_9PEZI|nr:hypothetical protein B0T19DRAFT_396536 [Cercophora scortea]